MGYATQEVAAGRMIGSGGIAGATQGIAINTPPLIDRLCGLRGRLLGMSMHLIAFEHRMNGQSPSPEKHPDNAADPYPPCSVEDILAQIETITNDIAEAHARIAQRF